MTTPMKGEAPDQDDVAMRPTAAPLGAPGAGLIDAWLAGRTARTLEAYRADLEDFRAFTGTPSVGAAAERLLTGGHGPANALALAYRASLHERGLASATINRRLAALRSLVGFARTVGLVPWALDVRNERLEPYRDTRGPGRAGVRRLFAAAERRADPKGLRDRAILRLLYDLALRRAEVVGLDRADVDLTGGTVAVLGKGRSAPARLTLPAPTGAALDAWLAVRGDAPGPLFGPLARTAHEGRLSAGGLYRIVRALGRSAGVPVRPHGLRHAAITEALDLTGGDLRAVSRYSRHRDLRVLTFYDDSRADLAGEVARKVAGSL